jgi:hypothetical protein
MRTESIYAAAVKEIERQRSCDAFMNWAFGRWINNALAIIGVWEKRKPPENHYVQQALERRG